MEPSMRMQAMPVSGMPMEIPTPMETLVAFVLHAPYRYVAINTDCNDQDNGIHPMRQNLQPS